MKKYRTTRTTRKTRKTRRGLKRKGLKKRQSRILRTHAQIAGNKSCTPLHNYTDVVPLDDAKDILNCLKQQMVDYRNQSIIDVAIFTINDDYDESMPIIKFKGMLRNIYKATNESVVKRYLEPLK